jgi:FixJ family two-component response regulator
MKPGPDSIVYLVDDDASILRAYTRLLEANGFMVRPFGSAREFIRKHDPVEAGCLLLDVDMPEFTGIEVQEYLNSLPVSRQIVFVSGRSDIPISVRAMKRGAVDFLTKPVNEEDLLLAVRQALRLDAESRQVHACAVERNSKFERLTSRERDVFALVVKGRLNKLIAGDLGIAEKTVKIHRANLMKKIGVRTVADLVLFASMLVAFGASSDSRH